MGREPDDRGGHTVKSAGAGALLAATALKRPSIATTAAQTVTENTRRGPVTTKWVPITLG